MGLLAGWDQNVVTDPEDSHFFQMLAYPIWDLEQPPPDDDSRVERYIEYFLSIFGLLSIRTPLYTLKRLDRSCSDASGHPRTD